MATGFSADRYDKMIYNRCGKSGILNYESSPKGRQTPMKVKK